MTAEFVDVYCPNCGHKGMWQDKGDPGDYYLGNTIYCFECVHEIYSAGLPTPVDLKSAYTLDKYKELLASAAEQKFGK